MGGKERHTNLYVFQGCLVMGLTMAEKFEKPASKINQEAPIEIKPPDLHCFSFWL
jgi:hypothetical protein